MKIKEALEEVARRIQNARNTDRVDLQLMLFYLNPEGEDQYTAALGQLRNGFQILRKGTSSIGFPEAIKELSNTSELKPQEFVK